LSEIVHREIAIEHDRAGFRIKFDLGGVAAIRESYWRTALFGAGIEAHAEIAGIACRLQQRHGAPVR
jgi:hypothetical protein